jgi:hypothetical protein
MSQPARSTFDALAPRHTFASFSAATCGGAAYCISAKRYVLFDIGRDGEIVTAKRRHRGSGNTCRLVTLMTLPAPSVDLNEIGVLQRRAVSRYAATTPALLKWFATFNSKLEYADQVKPFNFLNAFQARQRFELIAVVEEPSTGPACQGSRLEPEFGLHGPIWGMPAKLDGRNSRRAIRMT